MLVAIIVIIVCLLFFIVVSGPGVFVNRYHILIGVPRIRQQRTDSKS